MLVLVRATVRKTEHKIAKIRKGAWRKTAEFARFVIEQVVLFEGVFDTTVEAQGSDSG